MKRKFLLIIMLFVCLFGFTGCKKETQGTPLKENTDYSIKGEYKGNSFNLAKRGYYIDTTNKPDAPYQYIICMGQMSSGGYALKIKEVNREDNKTEVIVEEIEPGENEIVTMAETTPTIVVEFPKSQDNIVIKNTKGEEFKLLK